MVTRALACGLAILAVLLASPAPAGAQTAGGIRGIAYDKDLDLPLAGVKVSIVETGQNTVGTEQGNFVLERVAPGSYTLVFTKDGYARQVKPNVVVLSGQMTELETIALAGEVVEMPEVVSQPLPLAGDTQAALLVLRAQVPTLMDALGAEMMKQAGAGDAAAALKLVPGATVQGGKYATIRGLPDRYVNSQMNNVRLPTADIDKRAVELDQFPAAIIESIQVSKTFTPDQQGDASGGAVNLVLKGIPETTTFQVSAQTSANTQTTGSSRFLTYRGGGVNFLGLDAGGRDVQSEFSQPGGGDGIYRGAAGTSYDNAPVDYKWSVSGGGKLDLEDGVKVGAFGSFFYERSSLLYDNGRDDSWQLAPALGGGTPTYEPQISQFNGADNFVTSLYDVSQGTQNVKWGTLIAGGIEHDLFSLSATFLRTHTAEDKAVLTENTRGKRYYAGDDYDPDDPFSPGWGDVFLSPYTRAETLQYTERDTQTLQFRGRHTLPLEETGWDGYFILLPPRVDWTFALSSAGMDQPDKRLFGEKWFPGINLPGFVIPGSHEVLRAGNSINLGNFHRIWKDITEKSRQYFVNVKFPFRQWTDDEGYIKFGVFSDAVKRRYNQQSFSNEGDSSTFPGDFEEHWSAVFSSEQHPMSPFEEDVSYRGKQDIFAWYGMAEVPVTSFLTLVGGARVESTDLSIILAPDIPPNPLNGPKWFPPGATAPAILVPGIADVDTQRVDLLPSIGFNLKVIEHVVLRGSYAQTIARQTFKELTPVQQSEYFGGRVFVGNPFLEMAELNNYDLRLDYTPYEGGLASVSFFHKDVKKPIEYIQRTVPGLVFTFPTNYPHGTLQGIELEVRQGLGHFWEPLTGLSVGGNATVIKSEVTVPSGFVNSEGDKLAAIGAPMRSRDMTNAPAYLYNLYLTYDHQPTGTQVSIFYTVRGDTLVVGAGTATGTLVPNIYETPYGTLNLGLSQKIGPNIKLDFQAKNLTDPAIQEVYRSHIGGGDQVKTSYRKGIDFSLSLSARWDF